MGERGRLYKSLIRSILEYSSIIFPTLSDSNLYKLNVIQNKALKIINKKSVYTSMSKITTDIESLNNRADKLNRKYFENAFWNNNILIKDLCQELIDMKTHQSQNTILCKYKEFIARLFDEFI